MKPLKVGITIVITPDSNKPYRESLNSIDGSEIIILDIHDTTKFKETLPIMLSSGRVILIEAEDVEISDVVVNIIDVLGRNIKKSRKVIHNAVKYLHSDKYITVDINDLDDTNSISDLRDDIVIRERIKKREMLK